MDNFDFHIKTKKSVTRALIFNGADMIGEMSLKEKLEDGNLYIGSIASKFKNQELQLYLLGKPAIFSYCFNELFNISLNDMLAKKQKEVENFVIVNTPADIKQVILTIPDILTDLLKLPKTIILVDAEKSPFRLKLESMTNAEKELAGFGMEKHFIRYIPMITEKLTDDMLEVLNNIKTQVTCYKNLSSFTISFFS